MAKSRGKNFAVKLFTNTHTHSPNSNSLTQRVKESGERENGNMNEYEMYSERTKSETKRSEAALKSFLHEI